MIGRSLFLFLLSIICVPFAVHADAPIPPCCSSVAFLPALEGSRLYQPGFLFENRLWEPNTNADIEKLFLNEQGIPLNNDIYTRDAIDEVYGAFGNIYKTFFESLNALTQGGTIRAWQVLPYDWRLDLSTLLTDGVSLENGEHYDLIKAIEDLAANSITGKVTLIAHSNGGLLAKKLMDTLTSRGEGNLIDMIILVAVPQLGTPQTIAVMLHGQGQERGFGLIVNEATARTFAENMPAGYNLLPSARYFAQVSEPVVTFDAHASILAPYRSAYGDKIDSFAELHDFLIGREGRVKPSPNNITTPNVLNETLLDRAIPTHTLLDDWTPPAGISVVQIAGWGLDTLAGINYTEREDISCPLVAVACIKQKVIDYEPTFVIDGDGTVVIPSAIGLSANKKFYLNFPLYNEELRGLRVDRDHSSILEVQPIQELIKNFITHTEALPRDVTIAEPIPNANDRRLRLAVHSPVSLDLYDEYGAHTGIVTRVGIPSNIRSVENQIPNSYYLEFGEGKYAGMSTSGTTTLLLTGKELGTVTLNLTELAGDQVAASTIFSDIPVTAGSKLTANLSLVSEEVTLQVDADGNGTADATIASGQGVSTEEFLSILKGIMRTLHLPKVKEQRIMRSIEKVERLLQKESKKEFRRKERLGRTLDRLVKNLKRFEKKKLIDTGDVAGVMVVIEKLRVNLQK